MRMMKLLPLLCLLTVCAHAQTDSVYYGQDPARLDTAQRKKQRNFDWTKKLTYGGNFQLWFGNPTFVFLSPTIGFIPVENLNVGTGLIYNYTRMDYGQFGRYSQSIFGTHNYIRYIIADSYFVQTQYDRLRQPDFFSITPGKKTWIEYLLVGGGFRHRIGDRAALITSIMYNLTPHQLSIYPSRIIVQFGFTGGF